LAKPDCSQLDAVLAAVKAWPSRPPACVAASATASLDGVCARRHGMGRSGRRNGLRSNKETARRAVSLRHRQKKWPVSLFDLKSPFLRPDPWFAVGLVSRRRQGWPLRFRCGARRRFQATPWRRRARGHTGMDRGERSLGRGCFSARSGRGPISTFGRPTS